MITTKLLKVEAILEKKSDLKELQAAFEILEEILIDDSATDNEVAAALFLKGFIVREYAPSMSEYDEDGTGLIYYIQAMEYNPFCVGTLLNVVTSFNDEDLKHSYTQENKHAFVTAYEILKYELFDELTEDNRVELESFANKYNEFKQYVQY